jgi:hypothetical protein
VRPGWSASTSVASSHASTAACVSAAYGCGNASVRPGAARCRKCRGVKVEQLRFAIESVGIDLGEERLHSKRFSFGARWFFLITPTQAARAHARQVRRTGVLGAPSNIWRQEAIIQTFGDLNRGWSEAIRPR